MKRINKYICLLFALTVFACDPIENRDKLGGVTPKSEVKYEVKQDAENDFKIYLSSKTPNSIPFWEYGTANSLENSTRVNDTIRFLLPGTYKIKYTAYTKGGATATDSLEVTTTKVDVEALSDPMWQNLTNGEAGKTWTLDMEAPMWFFGTTYPKAPDNWMWDPKLKDQPWIMDDRYYGDMTFDLNLGLNYTKNSVDAEGNVTTCKGTFTMDLKTNTMVLKGCEVLFGSNFYSCASDWSKLKVLKITETELILGVLRDECEGPALYGFRYKVKS